MKIRFVRSLVMLVACFVGALDISSAPKLLKGCPQPSNPGVSRDKTFAPYELSFELPRRLKANVEYRTVPFYAVLLATFPKFEPGGDECDGGEYSESIERQRKQAQRRFPERKVFAGYQCPDMGAVLYRMNGKRYDTVFIAVYAGKDLGQARQALAAARARFPGASLRKMQAAYTWLVE